LALVRDGVPYLAVRAAEAIGVVGPLAVARGSACLHCVELRKAEGDSAWPKILAQSLCAEPATVACDVALAAMAAALGAAQALAFIDDAVPPAVLDGTLEVVLPGWQWRRRTWQPHPLCPCGAAGRAR
jgi:hypothetical protein